MIELSDAVLSLGENLLDIPQLLLGLLGELAVRELFQKLLALLLRAQGMIGVAIGFLHLPVMNVADFLLGFGRLLHLRIEQDEILVLRLCLRQTVRAAFAVPAIRD